MPLAYYITVSKRHYKKISVDIKQGSANMTKHFDQIQPETCFYTIRAKNGFYILKDYKRNIKNMDYREYVIVKA